MIIYPIPGKININQTPDISIIIPMYKSKKVIEDQIRRWPVTDLGLTTEIIYVDDKCPENSSQAVMQKWKIRDDHKNFYVKLIINSKNKGFGGACNVGAFHAKGKYLIFLNADTVPEPNWLKPIFHAFEQDEKIGIVGNLQLKEGGDQHGTIDGAGSEWLWGESNFLHIGRHILDGETLDNGPLFPEQLPQHLNSLSEREMVTGCCLAIRKDLFKNIGGFNERYRIGYWEDSEINMTVKEKGYRVVFVPNSIIWHKLSHAKVGKHDFHDLNKQHFMSKWDASGRLDALVKDKRPLKRPKVKKILVKREAANGDVLVAAGIIPALKNQYPEAEIHFCTSCPQVLKNNPYIDKTIDQYETFSNLHRYQRIIELDNVYERRPYTPIAEAYADEAGIRVEEMSYYVTSTELQSYHLPDQYIVFHAGTTNWVGRNWISERFEEIAERLLDNNQHIVCIGQGSDRLVPCTLDLRSRISLFEMNYVIKQSKLFVGIDSMPMHIAQIYGVPGVAFFGSINPKLRIYNNQMEGIVAPNLNCLGCHHRQMPPCTSLKICETGTFNCEKEVTTDQMWSSIERKLNQCNQNTQSV